jgi:hypothetical protein
LPHTLASRLGLRLATGLWLTVIAVGLWQLYAYENRPGVAATAPPSWPATSGLTLATDRPTLVFVAHPQCTCTRASLADLAEVLTRVPEPPKTYVLFLRPSQFEAGWAQTELWHTAEALPHATVVRDDDGLEARRLGVETSGQTMLYDSRGALTFSGGITASRGHAGENAGSTALLALLTRGAADRVASSVFGCPLFAPNE